ncbi:MAG: M48 family metalloprotease [Rubrivivax sp.]|nr:M48 family metalloprotease [Pyrinomonadaceae bacterium]
MYELLGICLALAALLALNACASLLTAIVWQIIEPHSSRWSASTRARLLFTLRVLPSALAAAFVFALVIPAYILHEPPHTDEVVGTKLLIFAAVSAAGVLFALSRIAGTWQATRKLAREWMHHAEPVAIEGVRLPAYSMRHRFPVIAVVGVLRPRLFIATQVFDSLTADELAAALAHERGHVEARDNLKRALLRAGQDALLFPPLGRTLMRAWHCASEEAADELAACKSSAAALNLAAAIVKISRMIPAGARPTLPAGAHLLGDDEDGLSRRVRILLRLAAPQTRATALPRSSALNFFATECWVTLGAVFLLLVTNPEVLKSTHDAIEHVVAALR